MDIAVYDLVVGQFSTSLRALSGLLTSAQKFAKERNFDENKFLNFSLAPDMFNFCKQIQITTDIAKGTVSRLSGKEGPKFEDNEQSVDQLLARVERTISFISEFKPQDFNGYADRKITLHYIPGKHMLGKDYLASHAIPNFYFHMMTAYNLLRSSGVSVGKNDFLGAQKWVNS